MKKIVELFLQWGRDVLSMFGVTFRKKREEVLLERDARILDEIEGLSSSEQLSFQSMPYQIAGDYYELAHAAPYRASILDDWQQQPPHPHKQEILNYLRQGNALVVCMGPGMDVIARDGRLSDAPHVLTDGDWIWYGDLAYYVEEYNLTLPKRFVLRMEQQDWQCPVFSETELLEHCDVFLDWCEQNAAIIDDLSYEGRFGEPFDPFENDAENNLSRLQIQDLGSQKIKVLSYLRKKTSWDLKQVKQETSQLPLVLDLELSLFELLHIQEELQELGATTSIIEA